MISLQEFKNNNLNNSQPLEPNYLNFTVTLDGHFKEILNLNSYAKAKMNQ